MGKRIDELDATPGTPNTPLPTDLIEIERPTGGDAGSYKTELSGVTRIKLTADANYTVPGDFATMQEANDYICSALDLGEFDVNVQLADGAHAGVVTGPAFSSTQDATGQNASSFFGYANTINWKGNASDVTAVTITPSVVNPTVCCQFNLSPQVAQLLKNVTLDASTLGNMENAVVLANGVGQLFLNIAGSDTIKVIGPATGSAGELVSANQGALVFIQGTLAIAGGNFDAIFGVFCGGSAIVFYTTTVALSGTVDFSPIGFAIVSNAFVGGAGVISFIRPLTITGTGTGRKFFAQGPVSVIDLSISSGSSLSTLAGDAPGAVTHGGAYAYSTGIVRDGVRTRLTTDTTFNVPADFATPQAAWDYIASLDLNGFRVTVNQDDDTYPGVDFAGAPIGSAMDISFLPSVIFNGNLSDPTAVIWEQNAGGGAPVLCYSAIPNIVQIASVTFAPGASVDCTDFYSVCYFELSGCRYVSHDDGAHTHIRVGGGSVVQIDGDSEIVGGGQYGVFLYDVGRLFINGQVTLTGTPEFEVFAFAGNHSYADIEPTFVGAAIGRRFDIQTGSFIRTGTDNLNYFPGSVAGFVDNSAASYNHISGPLPWPTSNPGPGKLWSNGGVITLGT